MAGSHHVVEDGATIDLVIFVVKIFLWFVYTGKIKTNLCQQIIIRASTLSYTWFYSTASWSFRVRQLLPRYLQVIHGKRVATFSVPDKLSISVRA